MVPVKRVSQTPSSPTATSLVLAMRAIRVPMTVRVMRANLANSKQRVAAWNASPVPLANTPLKAQGLARVCASIALPTALRIPLR